MEGKSLVSPISVILRDKSGYPVVGQMVFASIIEAPNGIVFPMGYPPYNKGNLNKMLLFPIPGIYSADYANPLSLFEVMYPLLTDSNG